GWILDDLLAKGIGQATVVLRQEDLRLQRFLEQAYFGRMDVATAPLSADGTIARSLQAGLARSRTERLVRVILGDTLIRDSYHGQDDFVYVGLVDDSRRWCLAVTGYSGQIIEYIDKKGNVAGPRAALAGYYHLSHGSHLWTCVQETIESGGRAHIDEVGPYRTRSSNKARAVGHRFGVVPIPQLVELSRRAACSTSLYSTTVIAPL